MDASIIIPTLNGGAEFIECTKSILGQEFPGSFEVILIDSESSDGCLEQAVELLQKKKVDHRLIPILRKNFQHGSTRNEAAKHARGKYLVYLTQDSIPHQPDWLAQLLNPYSLDPEIVGTFGRHVAHRGHPTLLGRNLDYHFNYMNSQPLRHMGDPQVYEDHEQVRQFLHFFSNNNSSMRKAQWDICPFPDVDFGEDQTWAKIAIESGKKIYYCHNSVVRHSHCYGIRESRNRAVVEMQYYYQYFGYDISQKPKNFLKFVACAIYNDVLWMCKERQLNWPNLYSAVCSHLGGALGRSFYPKKP